MLTVVPIDDPNWPYDPLSDSDGSGQAWLTQNEPGDTDVDHGAVRLTSDIFDLSTGNITISSLPLPSPAAYLRAAATAAPDEIPQSSPSSVASRRAISSDS